MTEAFLEVLVDLKTSLHDQNSLTNYNSFYDFGCFDSIYRSFLKEIFRVYVWKKTSEALFGPSLTFFIFASLVPRQGHSFLVIGATRELSLPGQTASCSHEGQVDAEQLEETLPEQNSVLLPTNARWWHSQEINTQIPCPKDLRKDISNLIIILRMLWNS